MLSNTLTRLVALLASASGALAGTPPGFEPATQESLFVAYGDVAALDGVEVAKEITQTAPIIASENKLDGASFAILMIDIDIPFDAPHTFLHWLQTGITQSSSATPVNTTTGPKDVFILTVPQDVEAFAPYAGPAPPARVPLSHRYTEILVDTSDVSDEALATLKAAAATRRNFVALEVLTSAGLEDKVVAGNFFNVTNPGPVEPPAPTNSSGAGNAPTGVMPKTGVATSYRAGTSLLLVMGALVFFAL
ncbi:PEBP-like protein [Xylariaceae sp. FL0594]|nr:PEBP-like protein [Xylariaceae sp. FL0594]